MVLSWVEVSKEALLHNAREFRRLVGPKVKLAAVVKANAYGHGMLETARVLEESTVDWFCVNALFEAAALRKHGIAKPIYVIGYVSLEELDMVPELDCRIVVYNRETVEVLDKVAWKQNRRVAVHLKVETGNNRQGIAREDILDFARLVASKKGLVLEGISSHYADVEDTTDHTFARLQLQRFNEIDLLLRSHGFTIPLKNFSNSAATILWPETHFDMVRVGICIYGMWPSKETYVSALLGNRAVELKPVLKWKTKIAQIKNVQPGEFVGYGRTYRTTHPTRLAVLPIGYYDGYDRKLSNRAHVLTRGQLAQVRGRVCMNMTMVDVTDIPQATLEDEVILIGDDGENSVTAEMLADWAGTINYEITTRINERIPRIVVENLK